MPAILGIETEFSELTFYHESYQDNLLLSDRQWSTSITPNFPCFWQDNETNQS